MVIQTNGDAPRGQGLLWGKINSLFHTHIHTNIYIHIYLEFQWLKEENNGSYGTSHLKHSFELAITNGKYPIGGRDLFGDQWDNFHCHGESYTR